MQEAQRGASGRTPAFVLVETGRHWRILSKQVRSDSHVQVLSLTFKTKDRCMEANRKLQNLTKR